MKHPLPTLLVISEPNTATTPMTAPHGWPLWRLGFRPFYGLAALWACWSVPYWVAVVFGQAPWPEGTNPMWWHAHEMLYGFAVGVIAGFLLTAVKAWTGLQTPRGSALAGLAMLWLTARLSGWAPNSLVHVWTDVIFLPVLAFLLGRLLVRARNWRNLPLLGLLLALALFNVGFHGMVLGWWPGDPVDALHGALACVVMVIGVMAGRVIPAFTRNVTPGLRIDDMPGLDRITLACTGVGLLLWVFHGPALWAGGCLLCAACGHAVRLWRWHPVVTRGKPILWILHLSYAWMPLGLGWLALALWNWANLSLAVHALSVGLIGGLIMGMITRTARGHTGRLLQVSRTEVSAYLLVCLAALSRVGLPLLSAELYPWGLLLAATAWSLAFALYFLVYAPWLVCTRLDGKDG